MAAAGPPTPQQSAALQSAASAPIATLPSGFGSAGNLQRAVSRKLSGWAAGAARQAINSTSLAPSR